jgi:putative ABC transport system permease protein
MDIPLIAGRPFADSALGTHSVIVNRVFAQRFLGKRNPVGTVFLWGQEGKTPYEIAGVVEVTKNLTIGEEDQPQIYESLLQNGTDRIRLQFVMRSATPPVTQLDSIRKVLRAIEPGAGIEVSTMYSSIGLAFLPSQVGALLLGSMGGLGLLLAMIGLYGVMVYMVTRRTREIGVRMAIGAGRAEISRMVLSDAARLMLIGSSIGLAIALLVTRPLAMFLVPGITPSDPLTFTAVIAVLALTGVVSCWGPVRRAASVDPVSSLRHD